MTEYKTYYKRNLPHYQPPGNTFFITFRLYGSLPVEIIIKLKAEREKQLKIISGYNNIEVKNEKYKIYQSKYFGKFDKLLDNTETGPKWLKNENIAEKIKEAILYRNGKDYELIAFTIMSNHVHLVITPIIKNKNIVARSEASYSKLKNGEANASPYIVSKIMQDLKSKTALECNKILNRTGKFWQSESYDHVVRNTDELKKIVKYVLNNPVKAGLCEKWEDWKWNYYNFEKKIV